MTAPAPALYVHIPFCETKCPYCDFNSFAMGPASDVDRYLEALEMEFEARGVPRDPPTIFVGGGTPTVVEPEQLARYLDAITRRVAPRAGREFTVEANPGSLTPQKIGLLREAGVTRISLGVQSTHDRHLKTLGRVHSVAQVSQAVAWVRAGGEFDLNLEFIHSVPGMTLEEWAQTLERAVAWQPEHLSCYALTFERGTPFFGRLEGGTLIRTPEELELTMFRLTNRLLCRAGFEHYEISNYCLPGKMCEHNVTYWRNCGYIGFGAGACSHLDGWRLGNERNVARYIEAIDRRKEAFVSREKLTGIEGVRETIVLGLRLAEGVDLVEVGERFGIDVEQYFADRIDRLLEGGLVHLDPRLRLARRGWRLADEIAQEFL